MFGRRCCFVLVLRLCVVFISEFRDVVLEDVVFDNDICYIDVTIKYIAIGSRN